MKLQVILVSGAVSFAVAGQAGAQSASEWTFEVTPYAWMTGLKGELGTFPGVPPVDVDLSFGDVLDNLDLGGMLIATASNGPWTIYLDMTIAQLSADEALGGVLFNRANIESETRMLALAVGRRVLETRNGSLDAYLGARAWWLKNSFALTGAGGGVTNRTEKADWVDPLIGLTGEQRLSDRWALFGAVEVGGFGVGADSEWSVLAGASYSFSDTVSASFGWRVLDVDYDKDGVLFDARQSGPVLGVSFKF